MGNKDEYIELVELAKLGDKDSMNRLVELARDRLHVFVYRMTLQEDLAQDIVQESMLEMFKVLGKLKQTEKFWPWIYTITYNKVRRHWRTEKRYKAVSLGEMDFNDNRKDNQGGLENLVAVELKELVLSAMKQLKESHRAVLTMRCYENMKYSEIAELMGSSELGTRMLFLRAKKSLAKQLSRRGLGRGALLTALVVFGKMTAMNEAAAAQVTVTAATTNVGLAAAVLGNVTGKAALTLTVASALAVSTAIIVPNGEKINTAAQQNLAAVAPAMFAEPGKSEVIEKYWHYYPQGPGGPVMTRVMSADRNGQNEYCRFLQDESANYFFSRPDNTIYINNFRTWAGDLSVPVLPIDKPEFVAFLSQIQEVPGGFRQVRATGDGLLIITTYDNSIDSSHSLSTRHSNVLQEDYFKYIWPSGAEFVDNRDVIHSRGWCYFSVKGSLGKAKVQGTGRIPLYYQTSRSRSPWLRLNINDPQGQMSIIDAENGAVLVDDDSEVIACYQAGSFFEGLSRQWQGLHTIDTVRRDAAKKKLWFETDYAEGDLKAKVSVLHPTMTAVYTIDMEKDVIDKITFVDNTGGSSETLGSLKFTYFDSADFNTSEFSEPKTRPAKRLLKKSEGISWLRYLAEGKLAER